MRKSTIAVALVLTATAAFADKDDCKYQEARRVTSPAAGITKIVVDAEAGSLHVDGRQNVGEVLAAGTACTSDDDDLRDITLTARRSGSTLYIESHVPDHESAFSFWYEARLDFGVVVPFGIAVEVKDGSGSTKVTNVGPTSIEDGSGSLEIRNIRGNLTVRDGSGEIEVDGVTGNVTVEDGSGEMTLRNIGGNVEIEDDSGSITVARVEGEVLVREDGSGSITAENVKRSVTVDDDGSGSIDVADIGGDFTVKSKGSGGIDYSRVAGRVAIPKGK